MAKENQIEILKKGPEMWNQWRSKNIDLDPHWVRIYNRKEQTEDLQRLSGKGVDFTGADLSGLDLCGANLRKADLREANLSGGKLIGANLEKAYLNGANLSGTDFSNADLSGADLSESTGLLNSSQLLKYLDLNKIRDTTDYSSVLSFIRGMFSDENTDITPTSPQLSEEADLISYSPQLFGNITNLSGAKLARANLTNVNLTRTNLENVDIQNATMGWNTLIDIDLSSVKGLDKVFHQGPSIIDIHTIYRSKGKIPENFLLGAGVPGPMVDFLQSHERVDLSVNFYSCFISFSFRDQEFANYLYSRMRDEGLRVWFAPEEIKGGRKIHEQIKKAIKRYDKLILVLSEESMKSEWVTTEIQHAKQREIQEQSQMLFPIRLVNLDKIKQWEKFDADIGKDIAKEIREYYIPDFSNWKRSDAFEVAFQRLLRDLKADE